MTNRDDPPEMPRCPRCNSTERVEVIDPPTHDPDARFFCAAHGGLVFTGSPSEAFSLRARDAARAAERGDLDARGRVGRELGVIGDER